LVHTVPSHPTSWRSILMTNSQDVVHTQHYAT
jgi:hypothetical protein